MPRRREAEVAVGLRVDLPAGGHGSPLGESKGFPDCFGARRLGKREVPSPSSWCQRVHILADVQRWRASLGPDYVPPVSEMKGLER
jgi:hypothetical protein